MSGPATMPTLSYPNLTTSTVRMLGEDLAVAGKMGYVLTNDSGTVMTTSRESVTISGLAI